MDEVIFLFQIWSLIPACPHDMVETAGICMDRYEAPNIKGERPLVMQSFIDATEFCEARSKRVCTEIEWERACEGKEVRMWSRGNIPNRVTCNNGHDWIPFSLEKYSNPKTRDSEVQRLLRSSPSGSFENCKTPDGVFDMDGNVEEWVRSSRGQKWDGVLKGGFWAKPWTKCRDTNDAHETTFRFYETGFRCCKDKFK